MEQYKTFREIISKIKVEDFDYMTMEEFNQFADKQKMSKAEWIRDWTRKIINDVRGEEIILKSKRDIHMNDCNTHMQAFKNEEVFDLEKTKELMHKVKNCVRFITGYLYEEFCRTAICVYRIEDYRFQIAIPEYLREFQVDLIRQEVQETLEALFDANGNFLWEDFKGIKPKIDYQILNVDENGKITGVNYILSFEKVKQKNK